MLPGLTDAVGAEVSILSSYGVSGKAGGVQTAVWITPQDGFGRFSSGTRVLRERMSTDPLVLDLMVTLERGLTLLLPLFSRLTQCLLSCKSTLLRV